MARDDLPKFPTPSEAFGRADLGNIPLPPQQRYGSGVYRPQPASQAAQQPQQWTQPPAAQAAPVASTAPLQVHQHSAQQQSSQMRKPPPLQQQHYNNYRKNSQPTQAMSGSQIPHNKRPAAQTSQQHGQQQPQANNFYANNYAQHSQHSQSSHPPAAAASQASLGAQSAHSSHAPSQPQNYGYTYQPQPSPPSNYAQPQPQPQAPQAPQGAQGPQGYGSNPYGSNPYGSRSQTTQYRPQPGAQAQAQAQSAPPAQPPAASAQLHAQPQQAQQQPQQYAYEAHYQKQRYQPQQPQTYRPQPPSVVTPSAGQGGPSGSSGQRYKAAPAAASAPQPIPTSSYYNQDLASPHSVPSVGLSHSPHSPAHHSPVHHHSPAEYLDAEMYPPSPHNDPYGQQQSPHAPVAQLAHAAQHAQHAQHAPQGPSALPSKRQDLRSIFDEVDRDGNGFLTERELSSALVNGDYTKFHPNTVRMMLRMFDRNSDGALYYEEFTQLWKYLRDWRSIFQRFDLDKSECITMDEFSVALDAFGYTLGQECVSSLFRSGSKPGRRYVQEMSFDMFVQTCINIKTITEVFKAYDTDRDGKITINFEDFLKEVNQFNAPS